MPAPLNVGFIGAGGIASRHFGVFEHLPDAKIVAVADLVKPRAEELAGRVGANVYTEYMELLDKEQPDVVYVTVPPFAHGDIELELTRRKLPFFVEKPLSIKYEQAEQIGAAIEAAGVVTAVGYHWRYFDTIDGVKNSMQYRQPRMALGYWMSDTPPPAWWRKENGSGGQLQEQATHLFDLARYLMGEVDTVYGAASMTQRERFPDQDIPDVSMATMRFKSGAIANISATCILNSGYNVSMQVFCEGEVWECDERHVTIDRGHGNREDWHVRVDPVWEEDNAFLKAVRANDKTAVRSPYSEALKTHRLVTRCVESAAAGKPLEVGS